MKIKFLRVLFSALFILSAVGVKANAPLKAVFTDSCCAPDSLTVISTNYPVFCVGWHVSSDSNCHRPYGFEIQWRKSSFGSSWNAGIKTYAGGSTVSFCATVDSCTQYQWRLRTICDTARAIYSDWIYGTNFNMVCTRPDSCCAPDSLKVISTTYPKFCVSWHVYSDSSCHRPYGFEIQWRHLFTSDPWSSAITIYTGGSTVNFCGKVDTCRSFEWRVRTVCDTTNGGTYSSWIGGPKFAMSCITTSPVMNNDTQPAKKPNESQNKFERTGVNPKAIIPKK